MNENENMKREIPVGSDNEAILAKKRPATPPQNQQSPSPRPAAPSANRSAGVPTQKRPVGNAVPRASAQRPQQNPQMRPADRTSPRPAPKGAAAVQPPRPDAPASRPAGGAATPAQTPVTPRPAPKGAVAQKSAPVREPAQRPVSTPGAEGANEVHNPPAYQSRRVMPVSEEEASGRIVPVEGMEKPKAEEKTAESKKNTSTKAGADIMVNIVKAIAYMAVILVVSVFISIFVIRIGNDVFAFVKSDEVVEITIPEDADIEVVSEILYDNGIISFPSIFEFYASLKEDDGQFIPGTYEVSPSMNYDELRYSFKEQVVTGTTWITIPEGSSVDEIIDIMVENDIGTREKYIEAVNDLDKYNYWFVDELKKNPPKDGRAYMLEGYLFPDTYEFYNASTEEMVVNKLLRRFNEVFVEDYRTRAADLGYTVDEILTIASLVEKEAGGAADYMYVSSVFHNRLKNPTYYPRLESDATTVYAIQIATGVRPDKITPEDNKFESPYNSYLNDGLVPGAITNPGASAIRYALYPAETNYYYFVTDNYGKAYFSSSKTEHDNYVAYVKQLNEQMKDH